MLSWQGEGAARASITKVHLCIHAFLHTCQHDCITLAYVPFAWCGVGVRLHGACILG